MLRKLTILLGVIIILVVMVAILTSEAALAWPSLLNTRITRGVESSTATHTSDPSKPASPSMSVTPAQINTTSTPIPKQMGQSATCFVPEQFPPFAFMPDGSGLLVRTSSGVQLFDVESGLLESNIQARSNVVSAALSPDGKVLAWALDDNTIQLVRLSDQQVLHTLRGHTDMVTKLRFSRDGAFLVSASHDYWVKVWSLSGEELISFQAGALGIGISPDGSMIATVPYDGPVALWDAASGEKIKDLGGFGGYDTSDAEFSPDGRYLAADLATGIFMWRISDASLIWNGVNNSMAMTFSPDGQYLVYSDISDNNKVILAAADTAQFIRVIDEMQSPVWELFFSQDGALLAVTDGVEIRIRQIEDGRLISTGKATCP